MGLSLGVMMFKLAEQMMTSRVTVLRIRRRCRAAARAIFGGTRTDCQHGRAERGRGAVCGDRQPATA